MTQLIALREYARRRGVALSAIQKAIKAGRITPINGQIDPEVADIQWERNTRPRAAARPVPADVQAMPAAVPPPAADDAEPYHVSRARRERAEAELAELRLAEERRDLIRVTAVRAALAATVASTRESLLQLPPRLATPLAAETDPARIYDLLHGELVQALEQIVAAPARLAPDEAPDDGS